MDTKNPSVIVDHFNIWYNCLFVCLFRFCCHTDFLRRYRLTEEINWRDQRDKKVEMEELLICDYRTWKSDFLWRDVSVTSQCHVSLTREALLENHRHLSVTWLWMSSWIFDKNCSLWLDRKSSCVTKSFFLVLPDMRDAIMTIMTDCLAEEKGVTDNVMDNVYPLFIKISLLSLLLPLSCLSSSFRLSFFPTFSPAFSTWSSSLQTAVNRVVLWRIFFQGQVRESGDSDEEVSQLLIYSLSWLTFLLILDTLEVDVLTQHWETETKRDSQDLFCYFCCFCSKGIFTSNWLHEKTSLDFLVFISLDEKAGSIDSCKSRKTDRHVFYSFSTQRIIATSVTSDVNFGCEINSRVAVVGFVQTVNFATGMIRLR